MGVSEKEEVNKEGADSVEAKQVHTKWVIAGIQLRAPLKPLVLTLQHKDDRDTNEWCSATPTSEESRIPSSNAKAGPPPPPRKPTPPSRGCTSSNKDFFCPPDLDSVFMRRPVSS